MENVVYDLAKDGKEIVIVNMIQALAANLYDITKVQRDIINEGSQYLKRKVNNKMRG